MEVMTFVVPCLFGLEGLAAEELRRLGLDSVQAENGRVLFQGGQEAMAMANLWLRTGERVLLRLAKGPARSFEELFQIVATTPLEEHPGSLHHTLERCLVSFNRYRAAA